MSRRPRLTKPKEAGGALLRWIWLGFVALIAVTILFSGWLWIDMRKWRPDQALYPEQGAVIASGTTSVRFETIAALGGTFVYLKLADANGAPDPGFASRIAAARATSLKVGIVFPFDPCLQADAQSSRFTRMVPRDGKLLPPAIELIELATRCNPAVSDAAVDSELMTLVNQIEAHSGQPVILKLGEAFERRHRTSRSLTRDLWLMRDRARPRYAGRPWLLWSANSGLMSDASEQPLEWAVVQN